MAHDITCPSPLLLLLGISGLFRLFLPILYSWSLTFTSADSPLRVVLDFNYAEAMPGHDEPTRECTFYDESCHKSMLANDNYTFRALQGSRHIFSHLVWIGDTNQSVSEISATGIRTPDLRISRQSCYPLRLYTYMLPGLEQNAVRQGLEPGTFRLHGDGSTD